MAIPILAVDDSAPIREMIASILKPKGYHVLTARGGRDALEKLQLLDEPHIILLDVVMPDLDGLAVVRAINQDASLCNAGHLVILMSSPLRLAARDIPATAGQLSKPFTRQHLIESITSASRLVENGS
jgi:CheY-like chemotaxis protein